MATTIEAIYDGEVLRLAEPLALAPNTRVRLTLEAVAPDVEAPKSFFDTAMGLNLQGPPDWSENLGGSSSDH